MYRWEKPRSSRRRAPNVQHSSWGPSLHHDADRTVGRSQTEHGERAFGVEIDAHVHRFSGFDAEQHDDTSGKEKATNFSVRRAPMAMEHVQRMACTRPAEVMTGAEFSVCGTAPLIHLTWLGMGSRMNAHTSDGMTTLVQPPCVS